MATTTRNHAEPPTSHADSPAIQVTGLAVDAPSGARILDEISFCVARGSLVAIVGPTGAGKTSLVRALTGELPLAAGMIRVDGHDVSDLDSAQRGVGFVPQDDLLHRELTLRRTLDHAAALRLPATVDSTRRSARVSDVLVELGLVRQADLAVGSLSVGQRKRASIAVELLGRPDVLVLDEPTSSLDPGYEQSVMGTLRDLADRGHCVLAVTHSLRAVAACDLVLFLATGGQVAFFGPPAEAMAYFDTADPGDLFRALDSEPHPPWHGRFRAHPAYQRFATAPLTIGPIRPRAAAVVADHASQLTTLVRRYAELIRSDRRHTTLLALQGLLLGTLLLAFVGAGGLRPTIWHGAVTGPAPSATGVAMLLVLCATWLGTTNAVREIVKERGILARERRAGLSVRAYVSAKMLVLGPITMLQCAALTAIAVSRQQVPSDGAVLGSGVAELMIAMAVAGVSAVALGLLISALMRTPDKALAVLPIVVVTEFVLSGLRPAITGLPGLAELRDLAGTHWAVEAIQATVAGDARTWWLCMAALVCLTAAALTATAVVVNRNLRLPSCAKPPLAQRWAAAWRAVTPTTPPVSREPARLALVGAASLMVVAVAVGGLQLVGSGSSTAPILTAQQRPAPAHVAKPVPTSVNPTPLPPLVAAAAAWPGILGNVWAAWTTTTLVGLDAAAVVTSAS